MHVQLIRHATLVVDIGGRRILVDPMLGAEGTMDPVTPAVDERRFPLVALPLDGETLGALIAGLDGVLVTHLHRDHWDEHAQALLPSEIPILCQPEDEPAIRSAGFERVAALGAAPDWLGLPIARTGGRHGTGEIGARMGQVSGVMIRVVGEPTLYIAGDTVWCAEVEEALAAHRPDVAVLNAGAAQFRTGDPITMTAEDVGRVCLARPEMAVIAVHMETVNHCLLTRGALRTRLDRAGLSARVRIPDDGETIAIGESPGAPA